jgi:hypothetical protein
MGATSRECAELEALLGGDKQGSKESAAEQQLVAQEEMSYYKTLYDLQAQLKIALLELAMVEEQPMPTMERLRQLTQDINNLRLQMDWANLDLQQEIRGVLSLEKYRQWRGQWQPIRGYDCSLLSGVDGQQMTQWMAVIAIIKGLMGQSECNESAPEATNYTQDLPRQSMERARQYSQF